MVIHDTTHPVAPLSIDRNMVGRELPVLGSASGLAYISFAPRDERAALLGMLAQSSDPHDALARDPAQVARLITATRRRGYGLRQGGQIWPHTGSIALPVRVGRRLLGCITTIWTARAMSAEEGVRRCLAPLRETRELIEARLAPTHDAMTKPHTPGREQQLGPELPVNSGQISACRGSSEGPRRQSEVLVKGPS